MKKLFMSQFAIGVLSVLVWSILGTVPASQAAIVDFIATDEPGPWFKCDSAYGCVPFGTAKTESLAIIQPGDTVQITSGAATNTVHTFTSLLWPTGAANMPFDQHAAFGLGGGESRNVQLVKEGLYVFVCKLHPFMLAATIVDNNGLGDAALELGETITLINGITVPTSSDLATRLLRAYFLITNPLNYQNHDSVTNPGLTWTIDYPVGIPVRITGGGVVDLKTVLEARYGNNLSIPGPVAPSIAGIGEVWIDTEYEQTTGKTKPGTATAVDTATWQVTKKVALTAIDMNNPHNMWTDKDQTVIYQTQWFDNKLTVFNRSSPFNVLQNINVGESPAHVMTRVDSDQVHVSINGGDEVIELSPLAMSIDRHIPTQFPGDDPAQPHAHWMSHDGQTMVTPNSNTGDSTRINIGLFAAPIVDKVITGTLPIATGMMPDASKYYVSNYLDSTITCISIGPPACKGDGGGFVATKNISLLLGGKKLANYDPIGGKGFSTSGALPIQTPVSPNGKWVVTANTLTGTISIIDTKTDKLVKILPCSAGCHGVNFGAKLGGGYYAYVSSKFSNDLIIVDVDPNNNGSPSDAQIAGRVVLVADGGTVKDTAYTVTNYAGMGGQGVLPIPNVYNGWVQQLPAAFCGPLTVQQRNPLGNLPSVNCP